MDGLSVLFGILTVLFLVVVVSMNILGTQAAPSIKSIELDQEGFVSTEGFTSADGRRFTPNSGHVQSEGFASDASQESKPTLGTKIKKVLDPLAFYTNPVQPEGTPIPEGKDLCTIFDKVRQSLAQSIKGTSTSISDGELMKKVEAQLAIDIPGGALPCPLLQYPADTATDLEWLSWLQTIPSDFGARVVLMASYADNKLTTVANSMKDALSGNIELPELPKESFIDADGFASADGRKFTLEPGHVKSEGWWSSPSPTGGVYPRHFMSMGSENFIDSSVCTPMLAEKKRLDQASASCTDPKTLSKEQIEAEVMRILKEIVSEKDRILASISLKDRTALVNLKDPNKIISAVKESAKDPIENIRSAKVAAEYLNTQKQKAEAGTLTPTGVNPKLV